MFKSKVLRGFSYKNFFNNKIRRKEWFTQIYKINKNIKIYDKIRKSAFEFAKKRYQLENKNYYLFTIFQLNF